MAPIRSIDGRGGRRVLLAWIRANPDGRAVCDPACAPYEYAGVNWTFGDFAALPRELSLARGEGGGATLAQRFVPELRALRAANASARAALALGRGGARGGEEVLAVQGREEVLAVQGRELELVVRAAARGAGCANASWAATVEFLRAPDAAEATALAIVQRDAASGGARALRLDRSRSAAGAANGSSWADPSNVTAPLRRREGASVVHAYVDRSIVEAIADNATAITARVFPQRDDGASVAVRLEGRVASDAPCEITANFTVWALDPIWAGA